MTAPTDAARSGLALLEAEMARQHGDALDSIRSNAEMARRLGASATRSHRLLLTGMGASHYANRIVEPLYRRLGIEAWAWTAAELIHRRRRRRRGPRSSSRNRANPARSSNC